MTTITMFIATFALASMFTFGPRKLNNIPPPAPPTPVTRKTKDVPPPAPPGTGTTTDESDKF
ncbi:MAG: hypothetical protein ACJ74W_00815 [Pyrinomonadaceae bacterium]